MWPALRPKERGLSSNAAQSLLRSGAKTMIAAGCLTLAATLAAQDDAAVTPSESAPEAQDQSDAAQEEPIFLDLSITVPEDETDRLIEKDCEEANEAGTIANEIVVCRDLGEASDGSFDKSDTERRYAERTKGASPPDTFGIPDHGNPIGFGRAPPPALLIDVGALPDAPAGSDADRIARGLPPLDGRRELTEDEERARREALGTPTSNRLVAPE